MALLKQKQVSGLTTSLGGKVGTASNQGAGTGLFKQKTTTDLEFYTLAGEGMSFSAPVTNVITIAVDVNDFTATKSTAAVGADILLLADSEDSNLTKKISVTNLLSGVSSQVDYADFSSVSATADGDSIIFFDASNSNATQRQLKSEFLVDYAKLASPTFTGTPASTTASPGTNTTQIATTAFVTTAVSAISQGLDPKDSVRAASTVDIDLTVAADPSPVGGVTLANGNRVALMGQTDGEENGIYVAVDATDPTTWTRSTDANSDAEVTAGMYFWVEEGTYGDKGYVLTTDNPITLDTTVLSFTQFSGLGQITAGNGLTKTGDTIDVIGTADRISVSADAIDIAATYAGQSSIVTLGTVTTGVWSGTAVGVTKGGTGLTTVAANTVLAAQGSADTVVAVGLTASTVLGRAATGNITAIAGTDLRVAAAARPVEDVGTLTASSMTLGTLSQTPAANSTVVVSINGLILRPTTDYTISSTTVTATNALNVAYGGTGSDGAGFENDDVFVATYEY